MEKYSIVVSVFNEEDGLLNFTEGLFSCLSDSAYQFEVIFVNDGSTDRSPEIINELQRKNAAIRVVHFSRNFGHESAMLAGIDVGQGDAVICMDADLQHPPEKISEMIDAYRKGADIVNMVRSERADGGTVKRWTSRLFYKLLNRISPVKFEENASDFFLISKRVAAILKENYRERARFLRGFIQMVGFEKTVLKFSATARNAGKSKYSLSRLLILSIGAIVSFSKVPLHLGIFLGVLFSVFSLIVGGYSIYMNFAGETPPGYTTLVVFMSISFAIMFFLIGIIGVYIGYIYDENKKRPIYIIKGKQGFDEVEEEN